MAEVKLELLIKELSARVDELEEANAAFKHVLVATIASLPADVTHHLRKALSDWRTLTLDGAPPSLVEAFSKRISEIESVVGSLEQ